MFDFRKIDTPDGNQIIDRSLKTPSESLSIEQMEAYIEMDNQLAFMDRLKEKEHRESERKQKIARNPFYRFAHICGWIYEYLRARLILVPKGGKSQC